MHSWYISLTTVERLPGLLFTRHWTNSKNILWLKSIKKRINRKKERKEKRNVNLSTAFTPQHVRNTLTPLCRGSVCSLKGRATEVTLKLGKTLFGQPLWDQCIYRTKSCITARSYWKKHSIKRNNLKVLLSWYAHGQSLACGQFLLKSFVLFVSARLRLCF